MRLLRTELLTPANHDNPAGLEETSAAVLRFREQVDVIENVLLAYGYEGNSWLSKDDWYFATFRDENGNSNQSPEDRRMQDTSNQVRNYLRDLLLPVLPEDGEGQDGPGSRKEPVQFPDRRQSRQTDAVLAR